MAATYYQIIALSLLSFAGIFYFLHRHWPSRFLSCIALAWLLEAARAAFLYVDLFIEGPGEAYYFFDAAYVGVTWLLLVAVAAFVERSLPRRWAVAFFVGSATLYLLLPALAEQLVALWSPDSVDTLGKLYVGPSGLFFLGAEIRFTTAAWLFRYWRRERRPGALIAALFLTLHGFGSLLTPVELWFFEGSMPGSEAAWFVQVLGLSVGFIILAFDRQQADLYASREALSEALDRLSAVLDSSPDAMITTDAAGTIVLVNRRACELLDLPAGALLGKSIAVLQEFLPCQALDHLLASPATGGQYVQPPERVTARSSDGATFPVEIGLRTTVGPRQRLHTLAFRDIRAELEAEQRRSELELQLRQVQKMEAVGSLAAGIAHDFNNLLTTILLAAEMLHARLERGTPEAEWLAQIRKAGETAADLTNQLLAFSRKQVSKPVVLDLGEVAAQISGMLARTLGEDIHLEFDCEPGCWVEADRAQLEQVFLNLAVNARDAMPEGGLLRVKAGHVRLERELPQGLFSIPAGHYILTEVQDTGVGIPAEIQERIFEPFFTTKELGHGTGLGLSTVYGIIKQSGGYITVESSPGAGTTFRLYFPARSAPRETGRCLEPPEIVAEAGPPAAPDQAPVLLVEDDAGARDVIARLLEDHGYRVVQAADAEEALAAFDQRSGRFAAVITDLVMPGLSGVDLAEALRKRDPAVRVLFITGYVDRAIARRLGESGEILLHKPLSRKQLLKALERLLQGRSRKA
ncbi:MAG: hypothetical protein Kow00109_04520 [Acidobacteriota bacterium]